MAELILPQSDRAFGTKLLVRASGKRRGNIDVSDPVVMPAGVVRTRDHKRTPVRDIDAPSANAAPVSIDHVAASARQIAEAAGSKTPIFREGLGGVDQSSYGSVGMGVRLANGNTIYFGGPTIIKNQSAQAKRALMLGGEQTLTEARAKLAAAITSRNAAQQAVDSKLAAWDRAVQHSDQAYATVVNLKKQQADSKAQASADLANQLVTTDVVGMPRTVAVSLELQKAEQAFDISTKARATVLADLQEKKLILQRSEEIVLGHAFEVLQSESSLLAITAREAVITAQHTLESLHALENVSHRFAKNGTRPQVLSSAAVETMSTHLPNAQGDAAESDAWADYIDRLTKNAEATKESQA